ncbi:MAG: peptidoglycan DD-metalloendopeptidase family protein [Pseudomonadota bacterium]
MPKLTPRRVPLILSGCSLALISACTEPLDFDLRGLSGGFSTSQAAQTATEDRPRPDNRGIISYPNFQVAVARRGDTLSDVASRVGLPADELGRFNGIAPDVALRAGEVIALPRRVAEPSPATGATGIGPIQPPSVDVTALAGNAIDNAAPTPASEPVPRRPLPQTGQEPIRHKVERGETAFTIARLYNVPAKSLAEWNGLGADFAVREGQFLLIPVARVAAPKPRDPDTTTAPGEGSPTPTPPSATEALPDDEATAATPAAVPEEPVADVGNVSAPQGAQFALPVTGSIIRPYAKGRNEGIDIKAAPGTPVAAAAAGTVAAITQSAEGIPIIVVRHENNLLTVYANVADVKVAKGDSVTRGQPIAALRDSANDAFVHFEVRDGFDSVDPSPFLE